MAKRKALNWFAKFLFSKISRIICIWFSSVEFLKSVLNAQSSGMAQELEILPAALIAEGDKLYINGDYEKALVMYDLVVSNTPDDTTALGKNFDEISESSPHAVGIKNFKWSTSWNRNSQT